MVELKTCHYGADFTAKMIRIAGCSPLSGQRMVRQLIDVEPEQLQQSVLDGEGDLYFSVFEKEAIIKRVKVPFDRTLDSEKLALFEFAATLLGKPEQYYLETYRLDGQLERLALAYHRELVDDRIAQLESRIARPVGFRLRSLALAAGYLNFCRPEGGGLICLIDITEECISYCFMNERHPVAVGFLCRESTFSGDSAPDMKRLLVDLTATLQYQKAELFSSGYSVPLSLILLSGVDGNMEMAGAIGEAMHVRAAIPIVRKELFSPATVEQGAKYLVSLGLTVDL